MLRELLNVTASRGVADVLTLAHKLNVGTAQVRWMLNHLRRLGYLEEVELGCSQPCERCPLHAACSPRTRARGWRVTESGRGALRLRSGASG
jgi:hypothetical protein